MDVERMRECQCCILGKIVDNEGRGANNSKIQALNGVQYNSLRKE